MVRVEVRLERDGDAAALAEAAVLGGRHERQSASAQAVEEGQVGRRAPAVEEPRRPARAPQVLAEEAEGRDAVAARDEEGLFARGRRRERPAQGAEALRRRRRAPSRTGPASPGRSP